MKKILQQDPELSQTSNTAAFAISVATEIFIRYLTDQAYNVVKSERKPRRNIAYKDIAAAVVRIDNLEFLSDVVPRTRTWREFKEESGGREVGIGTGTGTGTGVSVGAGGDGAGDGEGRRPGTSNGVGIGEGEGVNGTEAGQRRIEAMFERQEQQPTTNGVNGHGHGHADVHEIDTESVPHSPMADRTVGHGHPDPVRDLDVEMTD